MEKLLMFLMICAFVKAMENRNHPKFVRAFDEYERSEPEQRPFQKMPCSSSIDTERHNLHAESQCGAPKKVFYDLGHVPRAANEEVYPKAVWINQCVGLCDDGADYKCKPGKTIMRHIPLKLVNLETSKESCASYSIEEPVTCKCCQDSKVEHCEKKGKVLNPHKCACICPNQGEKRDCLAENKQWDRLTCTCEHIAPEIRVDKNCMSLCESLPSQ